MPAAHEYHQTLEAAGLLTLHAEASSLTEAKQLRREIVARQKRLRHIKRQINLDIQAIRSQFRDKTVSAGSGGSLAFSFFGKRKLAGQWRAAAKADIRTERDAQLAPYDDLKFRIDDALLQLDEAKLQIDAFVAGKS